jgi:hypothetical protein
MALLGQKTKLINSAMLVNQQQNVPEILEMKSQNYHSPVNLVNLDIKKLQNFQHNSSDSTLGQAMHKWLST